MTCSKGALTRALDWVMIVIIASVGVLVFPLFAAWFGAIYLRFAAFAPKSIWVNLAFCETLPSVLWGVVLGACAAGILRHRSVLMAILPSIIVCVFNIVYEYVIPAPYLSLKRWSWINGVFIGNWLSIVLVSFVSARFVLHKRRNGVVPT